MLREMIDSMEFWVREAGIDGFRCDMAHLVPLDFWLDARRHLDTVKPLFWLAETEDHNYQHVFDCSYAWHWMHLSESLAKGKLGMHELRTGLLEYQRKKLPHTEHLFFTSNHDENSWNGTEYEKYGEAALCLAVFACTWEGITLVYSGQELPNRRRLKFFDKDPIEWTGTYALHHFYQTLLRHRQSFGQTPARARLLDTGEHHVLSFVKTAGSRQSLVLINFSGEQQTVQLKEKDLLSGVYHNIFTEEVQLAPSLKHMKMPPWSYWVLERS